jgi:hypothetical protein
MSEKNPKQSHGRKKASMYCVPAPVLMEVGASMLEGGIKYGPYNFRDTPLFMSDYYDSTLRHMMLWWEGEDIDPDSGIHHVSKAIGSLMVLRDAMMNGMAEDDRPAEVARKGWMKEIDLKTTEIRERLHNED